MKKKNKELLSYVFYLFLLLLADQWTKHLAMTFLQGKPALVLLPGVLELYYLENTGAAFSLLSGQMWLFYLITPIFLGILGFVFLRLQSYGKGRMYKLLLLTLMAGAIGNYIDRLLYRHVVDFIYVSLIHFPVFNVADIYVTMSVLILIVMILFFSSEEELQTLMKPNKREEHE